MKVLVACEFSGIVRGAFAERGHDVWSCDLLPTESLGNHHEGDIFDILSDGWDLMIAHPPCTYISYAGTRHWNNPGRCKKRLEALDFFRRLWEADIEKICIENPRGCASPTIAKYSQIINPYYFGDEASKPTWLWLKNLPQLIHAKQDTLFEKQTHVSKGEFTYHETKSGKIKGDSVWFSSPPLGHDRTKWRSRTFPGIATAMAKQWGNSTPLEVL